MTLLEQFRTVNKSAVAVTIGQAFLVGYSVPFVTMIVPHFITTDYVAATLAFWRDCLSNPAWLFLFFKATLNSGISFALGALMKTNAFDRFKTFFPASQPSTEPQPVPPPVKSP